MGFDSSMIMTIVIVVVVIVISLASFIPMIFIFGKFFKRQAATAKLMQTGEAAQGQILSIQETGTRINDQPEVAVALMVTRPGQAPYQVQTTIVVSVLMIPRLQPGMSVPVKVDPMNPQSVAIDKGALGMGGMPAMGMQGMGGMPGMGMPAQAMPQPQYGQPPPQPGMPYGQQPGMPPQQAMPYGQPGMMPGGMSQQQAMAMAQQAMAQPPAGGAIIYCQQCRNPYAIANPRCPNCGAAKPG